jgi:hypothetical protein
MKELTPGQPAPRLDANVLNVWNETNLSGSTVLGGTTTASGSIDLSGATLALGSPTATTQSAGDNSTKVATTAYSDAHFPGTLSDNQMALFSGTTGKILKALAFGTANQHLFMNAGASAPEFATGMKLISQNYTLSTASGTFTVTGVGFKPSFVIIAAGTGGVNIYSMGIDNGTLHGSICGVPGSGNYFIDFGSFAGYIDTSNYVLGYVSAWGSDGCTMSITKTGSPTGTMITYYWFFR